MKKRSTLAALVLAALLVTLVPATSNAIPVLVTSRGALGGNDFFNWGVVGSEATVVASPFSITSNGGTRTATVRNPTGQFERLDQSSGWGGNFAPGDRLLWTGFDSNGPMSINFSSPVLGAGAQIQADSYGSFVGQIDVFNALNVLLATFNWTGVSDGAANNSTIFLGVFDSSGDIGRIDYRVTNSLSNQDFAINQLDIRVPEPGTLMLLGSGLAGLALLRRRNA